MSHSHSSYRGEPGAFQPQGHVEQPCPKASERNGALRHIYVSANGWWNCGLCQYAPAPAAPAPRAEEPSVIEQAAARVLGHCKLARFAGAKGMNLNPDGDGAQVLAYIGDLELVAEAVKSLTADLARANEERAAGDDAQRGITEAARILSSAGIEDPDGSITGMATNAAALIERLRAEAEAAREQCANLVCKDCEGDVIRIGAWHYHTDEQATEHRGGWPCPAWPIHALNRLSPSPTPTEAS